MTGRDLIVYILTNHLEDEPVIKNGMPIGFMTLDEAAAKSEVGSATMQTWINMGLIESFNMHNGIIVPKGGFGCVKN